MRTIQDFVAIAVQFEHLAAEAPHPALAKAYLGAAQDCRAISLLRRRLISEGLDVHTREQQRHPALVVRTIADERDPGEMALTARTREAV